MEAQTAGFFGAQTALRLLSRRNGGAWEQRHYLCSREVDAHSPAGWADRIRRHWSVENKNHWRKDATLYEDATRSRQPNILANLMLLRQLTLHFYEEHGREDCRWLKEWVEKNQRHPIKLLRIIGV